MVGSSSSPPLPVLVGLAGVLLLAERRWSNIICIDEDNDNDDVVVVLTRMPRFAGVLAVAAATVVALDVVANVLLLAASAAGRRNSLKDNEDKEDNTDDADDDDTDDNDDGSDSETMANTDRRPPLGSHVAMGASCRCDVRNMVAGNGK